MEPDFDGNLQIRKRYIYEQNKLIKFITHPLRDGCWQMAITNLFILSFGDNRAPFLLMHSFTCFQISVLFTSSVMLIGLMGIIIKLPDVIGTVRSA